MKNDKGWQTIGSIRKSKEGKLYFKVDEDVNLTKGSSLQLQDPRKRMTMLAEKGFLTKEAAEERIANIPEYVRYDVVIAPKKD